jgi:hypothetical protein
VYALGWRFSPDDSKCRSQWPACLWFESVTRKL